MNVESTSAIHDKIGVVASKKIHSMITSELIYMVLKNWFIKAEEILS